MKHYVKFLLLILVFFANIENSYSQKNHSPLDKEFFQTPDSYVSRADVLDSLENHIAAIELYTKSIEIYGAQSHAYFKRGQSKMALEDYRGALLDFDISEKNLNNEKGIYQTIRDPLLSIIYMSRGLAYSQLNENDLMCFWLRKSGEKGNRDAFNLIKKYCQ
jgi:tetratricopeptide (TPR) repeat protein